MKKLVQAYIKFAVWGETWGVSITVLLMRLWMARIFLYAGLTKISDWNATLFLFKDEYKVPILPPDLAATMAATTEMTCPFLLMAGFATRFATLPMLAMTAVIELTYQRAPEHLVWAIMLSTILFYGAGKISVDYFIQKAAGRFLR